MCSGCDSRPSKRRSRLKWLLEVPPRLYRKISLLTGLRLKPATPTAAGLRRRTSPRPTPEVNARWWSELEARNPPSKQKMTRPSPDLSLIDWAHFGRSQQGVLPHNPGSALEVRDPRS